MVHELVFGLGDAVGGREEERRWCRFGVEAAAVRVGSVSLGDRGRAYYNPVDYLYVHNFALRWRQLHGLLHLFGVLNGQAALGVVDASVPLGTYFWQKCACDIVARRDREWMQGLIRCLMIGMAGACKLRIVCGFVRVECSIVNGKVWDKYALFALQISNARERSVEAFRRCCHLSLRGGCVTIWLKSGASTWRGLLGNTIGYCGSANVLGKLYVLDERSLICRRMRGGSEFKCCDHRGRLSLLDRFDLVLGQKDVVMFGDPHGGLPLGHELFYHDGEYTGKAENEPHEALDVSSTAWLAGMLVKMGVAIRGACEVYSICPAAGDIVQSETRALDAEDSARFLQYTRSMADCTWSSAQWNWLALRNRCVLRETLEGRSRLLRLDKAPLLVDTRVDMAAGRVGLDRLNGLRLQQLSARADKSIIGFGAHRARPANQPDLKSWMLVADNFSGMPNSFVMCEGACVVLTCNTWKDAGFMNGAIGTLKGSFGLNVGDPNSSDLTKRSPLALIVEFDEVNLKDESGEDRSFFPGLPEKKWVPVWYLRCLMLISEDVPCCFHLELAAICNLCPGAFQSVSKCCGSKRSRAF